MAGKSKKYTNGEVTIHWTPESCIHSGICVAGLPHVFKPKEKPWITVDATTTDALIAQVKKCPSGALSYTMNDDEDQCELEVETSKTKVEVRPNGPLLIHGTLEVKNASGQMETRSKTTAFCRCGASANKPYCDGQHAKVGFVAD